MPDKTSPQQQKTKELKTFSVQVVTLDQIRNDKRKSALVYIIKSLKEVSEKGLSYLINYLKEEKKIDLGYNIIKIGNKIIVKELNDDIKLLLYVGIIEMDLKTRKLRLTSNGQEFLEGIKVIDKDLEQLLQLVEEYRNKIVAIDEEISLITTSIASRRS
ncbi:MAG: hypothetical protein N3D82_03725 [Ignisphaera sp.]|nr:hypothetical protein [Ignisphaera sp.]MCX8168116.1 hypothetical protein [Ignisphaera sp.]MDW8085449.1 hypothetical protein [Ignisphaera sp.]